MPNEPNGHASRYQGRNLLWLVVAICGPAAMLYLRIVFAFTAAQAERFAAIDRAILGLFFCAQAASAWYLRRLLPARRSAWMNGLQVAVLFMMGLLFSITGAVMLEAFGYSLFVHLHG